MYVPYKLFDAGLDPYSIAVYGYLARCAELGNTAFPSINTIAKKTNMSKPRVTKSIRALEDAGFVIVHRQKDTRDVSLTNRYELKDHNQSY